MKALSRSGEIRAAFIERTPNIAAAYRADLQMQALRVSLAHEFCIIEALKRNRITSDEKGDCG